MGGVELLKRAGFVALAMVRVAKRSVAPHGCCQAVVDVGRAVQADAGMAVFVVVQLNKISQEASSVGQGADQGRLVVVVHRVGDDLLREMSKMMLAAYNAEAENAIKTVRAGGLSTAQARLEEAADRVAKNGDMISLTITPEYHRLRSLELELVARHLTAVQAEKEAERAHREELRDAKRAEEESQREREKLDKEREHYVNALASRSGKGNERIPNVPLQA